eukprot:jgi/Tetstr1/425975/TSEL_016325.t1
MAFETPAEGVDAALEGLTLSPDRPGEEVEIGRYSGSLAEFRILPGGSSGSLAASVGGSSRRSSQLGDWEDEAEEEEDALAAMARSSARLRALRQQRQSEAEDAARELVADGQQQTPPLRAPLAPSPAPSSAASDSFAFPVAAGQESSPDRLTPASACSTATPASRPSAGLPPRSGMTPPTAGSSASDASAAPSVGKYVPPVPKHGAMPPGAAMPRYTPPHSPARAGMHSGASSPFLLSPQRPPSGPSAPRFSPAASPHAPPRAVGHSPSKPPTTPTNNRLQNLPRTPPSSRSALTPYNMNVPRTCGGNSSQKSAFSCYSATSAPNTPGSHSNKLIDPELAASLTKTAIKRAVHDARAEGLTFNQKKHRSPSHIRRSQRRQQERLNSPSPSSLPQLTPGGSTARREGGEYVDPWDEAENKQPDLAAPAKEKRSPRQQLSFDAPPLQRSSSLRGLR